MNKRLTECGDCGKEISRNAEICPHCGVDKNRAVKKTTFSILGCLYFTIGCLILILLIGFFVGCGACVKAVGENAEEIEKSLNDLEKAGKELEKAGKELEKAMDNL